MKKYIVFAAIAATMFVAPSAMAQKGSTEMSFSGNIESATNSYSGAPSTKNKSSYVNADVGRYITNKLVVRVSVGQFGSESNGVTTTMTNIGGGVKFYFGEPADSKWIPFVNGGLNVASMKSGTMSATGYGLILGGGVSQFLTEQVSLDMSLQAFTNSMNTSNNFDYTNSGSRILFGITARY